MEIRPDENKLSAVEQIAIIMLIASVLFILMYQIGIDIYEKRWLNYDKERLEDICKFPKMYGCDDLNYAAAYCTPARIEGQSKCGQNSSMVIMP